MSGTTLPHPTENPGPSATLRQDERAHEILTFGPLTHGSVGHGSLGFWGMLTLILTEACLFGYLLFSYWYMHLQSGPGFLPDELPGFHLSGPGTALLLSSSLVAWFGEHRLKRGAPRAAAAALALAAAMGAVFMALQIIEWRGKGFGPDSGPYGSLYFTLTGFHLAHVAVGILALAAATLWTALGLFDRRRHAPVSLASLYWHFVDAVWLALFATFYLAPHLR